MADPCCREPDYETLVEVRSVDLEEQRDFTGRIVREYRRVEQVYCRRCLTVRSFVPQTPAERPKIDVVRSRIVDPNYLPEL